ncbi:hypothetical protein J21TS3_35020 [Paenibacillus cookii]|uniref:Uncharacterized protein n=1 Tax=Paenibacillus cookii TaxID=157839 RepID=A0ABQ4LZH6_9BACL|nr:hypothetical protein J21TS3_35020 [Paenibacillus cookii]
MLPTIEPSWDAKAAKNILTKIALRKSSIRGLPHFLKILSGTCVLATSWSSQGAGIDMSVQYPEFSG